MELTADRPAVPFSEARQKLTEPEAIVTHVRRRGGMSPLTRRIFTVNSLALGILLGGLLFLGQYEDGLIEARLTDLTTQGEIFAGAIGQGGVGTRTDGSRLLLPHVARPMMRRLVAPTRTRARLFATDGRMIADSRVLLGPGGSIQVETLPPPADGEVLEGFLVELYDTIVALLPTRGDPPRYEERANQQADDYEEVLHALAGDPVVSVRKSSGGHRILIAAVPVQRFKQILGALMVTTTSIEIERAVREVRFGILKVFAIALGVTVLLSFYLAGTIARPIRRLAEAADLVRGRLNSETAIPDFTKRNDEIGDLSGALREMTEALWDRMQAIESFAADVSHEIKNPLTSLRSAVETASRLKDPEQQRRLMEIIQEDVKRLDRLITDISGASRIDAELARAQLERVDISQLLKALVQVHGTTDATDRASLEFDISNDESLYVVGIEGRIVQVVQNLIGNAFSFTPTGKSVRLAAMRDHGMVQITVDDDGPGIPEDNLASVFERFYSERPDGEQFGTHSGLGLSISRQIVEALGGTIKAANRYDSSGTVTGAQFTVRLPAA